MTETRIPPGQTDASLPPGPREHLTSPVTRSVLVIQNRQRVALTPSAFAPP